MGTDPQYVAQIGKPPAYFYAISTDGTLLPILGGPGVSTPALTWVARIQSASHRTTASVDVGEGAPYNGYTIIQPGIRRSEEHTSELQSLMLNSYAVFCLKKN